MRSMHLFLVVSCVVPLTLSLLAVRVADVPVTLVDANLLEMAASASYASRHEKIASRRYSPPLLVRFRRSVLRSF
ncbi:hypothetical protein F5887DRAFT_1027151 [Amanita rubescens]|nr:hypothetical protein F5887DRAFT_1027151 [Amanita rubescens]